MSNDVLEIRDPDDTTVRPGGLYTVPETARALQLSRSSIYSLMQQGLLEYSAVGPHARRRVFGKSILALLQPGVAAPLADAEEAA